MRKTRSLLTGAAAVVALLVALPVAPVTAASPVAPPSVCPDQTDAKQPKVVQVRAMRCMVNFARTGQGLPPLQGKRALDLSASLKSKDILVCDSFDHEACGRDFTYWMRRVGQLDECIGAGENIAWGTGSLATVRSIFIAWMRSPGHRANILGDYERLGVGLRIGTLEGNRGAHVWTQHFVSGCKNAALGR